MSGKEMKLHEMKRENDKDMIVNDSTENNDAFDWFNFDFGRKTRVEELRILETRFILSFFKLIVCPSSLHEKFFQQKYKILQTRRQF